MSARILVADDDETHAELVRTYLEYAGHTVIAVQDGRTALSQARLLRPDLLVLDVMMPGLDGLEVCRILRRESQVPMLLLTARSAEDDLVVGLGLGADDYMTKPYSPRELIARIGTLLSRSQRIGTWQEGSLHVGALTVDAIRHQVWVGTTAVDCTPGEFQVLAALAAQPGRVFTRKQLIERLPRTDVYTSERTIDMHVMNLRRKTEADPRNPVRLVTVFGVGYKLVGEPNGRHRAP
jgi:DNA-binding response OmpR family regulator